MFLYELAMELDERSIDVAQAAVAAGLGAVGPTSELTGDQVVALRALYRGQVPPPPPPPSVGSVATAGDDGPLAWGPADQEVGGIPPGSEPPSSPPAASSASALPPPPPPPPVGTAPTSAAPSPSSAGEGRPHLVAIGVVVLLVVALFAYMATNSGPDPKRKAELAANQTESEARQAAEAGRQANIEILNEALALQTTTTSTVASTTVVEPGGSASTAPTTSAPTAPVGDVAAMCASGDLVTDFEIDLSRLNLEDEGANQRFLVERRSGWELAVADLLTAAPDLSEAIVRYRDRSGELFDRIEAATGTDDMYDAHAAVPDDLTTASELIVARLERDCPRP